MRHRLIGRRGMIPLLLLLLLLPGAALAEDAAARAEAYTEITDRAGVAAIADDPSGRYRLMADLDLGDAPWTPIPLTGELDGNGHRLLNVTVQAAGREHRETVDGNRKPYDTVFAGLFSTAENAYIHDLTLLGMTAEVTTAEDCFAAGLCGYAAHTVIEDCTVQCRIRLTASSALAGVGGLAGYADESEFSRCGIDAELVFTDTDRETPCEEFLGGGFACGCGKITDCHAVVRGYASIYGYAHNGGFVGMHINLHRGAYVGLLARCTVDAEIRFFEKTASRRAYCEKYIGENLAGSCYLTKNRAEHFRSIEQRKDYETVLLPEMCASPVYEEETVPPDCWTVGYTVHTCTGCGYHYTDRYTLPAHDYSAAVTAPSCTEDGYTVYTCTRCEQTYTGDPVPAAHTSGPWQVLEAAQAGIAGCEEQRCSACGAVLQQRQIPPLPAPTAAPQMPAANESTTWAFIRRYILFGWLWER